MNPSAESQSTGEAFGPLLSHSNISRNLYKINFEFRDTHLSFEDLRLYLSEIKKIPFEVSYENVSSVFKVSGLLYYQSNVKEIINKFEDKFTNKYIISKKNNFEFVVKFILEGIRKMGFKNTKENREANKTSLLYAVNDNCNDCKKQWATFPVLLVYQKSRIEMKIIFAINSKPGIFDPRKIKQLKNFIEKANSLIKKGQFHWNSDKKHTYYKICQYELYPPNMNYEIPQLMTSEAIHIYTSYGYGLYEIYNSDPLPDHLIESENKKIIQLCQRRSKKPLINFTLTTEESVKVKDFSTSKDEKEEEKIIEQFKNDKKLNEVFLLNRFNFKSTYPEYLRDYEKNKKLNPELVDLNPDLYEEILKLVEKTINLGYYLELKKISSYFFDYENKIYYNFKQPIHKTFIKIDKNNKEDYIQIITQDCINVFQTEFKKNFGDIENFVIKMDDLDLVNEDSEETTWDTSADDRIYEYCGFKVAEESFDSDLPKHEKCVRAIDRFVFNTSCKDDRVFSYPGLGPDMLSAFIYKMNGISLAEFCSEEYPKRNTPDSPKLQLNEIGYSKLTRQLKDFYKYLESRYIFLPTLFPNKIFINQDAFGTNSEQSDPQALFKAHFVCPREINDKDYANYKNKLFNENIIQPLEETKMQRLL
jgi:hypothetical protein